MAPWRRRSFPLVLWDILVECVIAERQSRHLLAWCRKPREKDVLYLRLKISFVVIVMPLIDNVFFGSFV